MFGCRVRSTLTVGKVFGARQDDVSIQGFSLQAAKCKVVFLFHIEFSVHPPTHFLLSLPSVDALSLGYRMSLYGINLYHVRKSRAQALDGLLLTIAKGSSGR